MMKRILLSIACLAVCLLSARAQTVLIGSLTTVDTNTVNSAVFLTNNATIRVGTILVTSGGLGNTNDFTGNLQVSLNTSSNFTTVGATYQQPTTNAQTGVISPATYSFPVYARMTATTTNRVNLGASYLP